MQFYVGTGTSFIVMRKPLESYCSERMGWFQTKAISLPKTRDGEEQEKVDILGNTHLGRAPHRSHRGHAQEGHITT